MSHFSLKAFKEGGLVGVFKQLYKLRTLKQGTLVGVDRAGNKYYENTVDYPFGQHRWVEYAGNKNFYEVDASNVTPEWHSWLHNAAAEPPTDKHVGSTWRHEPLQNAHGVSTPYKRNLGGVVSAPTPNLSSYKPRGFGLSNGIFDDHKPNEELFYTQPGHIMDKRNRATRRPNPSRTGFTLADTPETLKVKEAGRAGMSVAEYDSITDPASPTNIALLVASGYPDFKLPPPGERSPAEEAILGNASIPTDPVKKEVAIRMSTFTGHARSWGAQLEAGTFAAARAEVLSPEEEAFLEEGHEEEELLATIAQYQNYVESYADVKNKDAAAGLEKALEVRDAAVAKLKKLREVNGKLEALSAKWDAASLAKASAGQ